MPVRVNLPDGSEMLMHPATVNDQIEIYDMAQAEADDMAFKRHARDKLNERAIEPYEFGDLSPEKMVAVYRQWVNASEEDAVPFDSGSDSGPEPSQPSSPTPTAKRARSPRQASTSP